MDGLEAAQAEMEKGLPKLSNGKATGRAGKYLGIVFHESWRHARSFGQSVAEWQRGGSPLVCQAQGSDV